MHTTFFIPSFRELKEAKHYSFLDKCSAFLMAKYFAFKAKRALKYRNAKKEWFKIKNFDELYIAHLPNFENSTYRLKNAKFYKGLVRDCTEGKLKKSFRLYYNSSPDERVLEFLGTIKLDEKYMGQNSLYAWYDDFIIARKPEHIWFLITMSNKSAKMTRDLIRDIEEVRKAYRDAVKGFYQAYGRSKSYRFSGDKTPKFIL